LLDAAARRCNWTKADYEELAAGKLPSRTLDDEASRNVARVLDDFPDLIEQLSAIMKRFGADRLDPSPPDPTSGQP
jgi:hypothetical protein